MFVFIVVRCNWQETCEEATQSLYPLVGANGMDWMYANCSTTAQRGALDWMPKFEAALKPVFEELYAEVENGMWPSLRHEHSLSWVLQKFNH